MKTSTLLIAAGALTALAGGTPAWAQNTGSATTTSQADRDFITHATTINDAEIKLGQLAEQRAPAESVKTYGRWLASAHGTAQRVLLADLNMLHMQPLQAKPTAQQTAMAQKLEGLRGAAFDREYLHMMVEGHEKAIPLFQKEAQGGQNAVIKTYAETMVPTLQDHLAGAQALEHFMSERTARAGQAAGGSMGAGAAGAGAVGKQP